MAEIRLTLGIGGCVTEPGTGFDPDEATTALEVSPTSMQTAG